MNGLFHLTSVGRFLAFRFNDGLINLNGLSNLTSVKNLWLEVNPHLSNISGLSGISTVDSLWIIGNYSLTNLNAFSNLSGSVVDLAIFRNGRLTDLDGLSGITSIADTLVIAYESSLSNLDGLSNIETIGGGLQIFNNPSLKRFCGLYTLLNNNGLAGEYDVHDNSYNPTQQEIIDCGPCLGISEPSANAGNDMTVIVGGTVNLDGSDSSDPDSDPLSYNWTLWSKPYPSTAVLSDNTNVSPTFTADLPGNYVVRLRVFDGCALSDVDQVTIIAKTIEDAAEEISEAVQELPLSSGNKNALASKLQNALKKYNSGDLKAAKNILNAFINQLYQFIADGSITLAQAQPLIDYVNQIIDAINASLPKIVNNESIEVPTEFGLNQNYPNPFNPSTKIKYSIPNAEFVTLKIYDLLGREVVTLVNENTQAGSYEVIFDASELISGVYFYKLTAGSFTETKKMLMIK